MENLELEFIIEDPETALMILQEIEQHELTVTIKPSPNGNLNFIFHNLDEKLANSIASKFGY